MTQVISMRLKEDQVERLRRVARRMGRTPSETGALLVEEALRRSEFALIDFRDSPVGRQAYIQGSTLAVWEVVLIVRDHDNDADAAARYLSWPRHLVQAALNYGSAYPDAVEAAIADNHAMDFANLVRQVPAAQPFSIGGVKSTPAA